jgi:hypothetical protein
MGGIERNEVRAGNTHTPGDIIFVGARMDKNQSEHYKRLNGIPGTNKNVPGHGQGAGSPQEIIWGRSGRGYDPAISNPRALKAHGKMFFRMFTMSNFAPPLAGPKWVETIRTTSMGVSWLRL